MVFTAACRRNAFAIGRRRKQNAITEKTEDTEDTEKKIQNFLSLCPLCPLWLPLFAESRRLHDHQRSRGSRARRRWRADEPLSLLQAQRHHRSPGEGLREE